MNTEEFLEFADRYKNWGRWGPDDEAGTLNFVSPRHIVQAARLVRRGRVFSLAIPFDETGPQPTQPGRRRFNPVHTMTRKPLDWPGMDSDDPPIWGGTDDEIMMPLQCATQWDALAHVIFRGKTYNGRPYSVIDERGAHKNGIDKIKDRAVGRGVLLDIPRHRGVRWVEPGQAIGGQELDDCAQRQGVSVQEGDFLLVRTGHVGICRERGSWEGFTGGPWPGIDLSAVPWLHEKRVAAVASDSCAVEVDPSDVEDMRLVVHLTCIANMGMLFGEIFDLEELSADCGEDGLYEFFFVAAPLPVTGAVGSPINPYAIK